MTKHLHVYRIFPYRAIFANAYGFNFWLFSLQLGNRSKQLSVFKEEKQVPVHFCWIYQREKWCLIVPPKGSLILEYVPGFGRSFEHDQRCIQYIVFFGFTRCDVTVILMNYCNKLVTNIVKPVYSLGDWWPIQRILWLDTAKEILLVQGNFGLSRGYRWSKPSYIYFQTKFSRGLIKKNLTFYLMEFN